MTDKQTDGRTRIAIYYDVRNPHNNTDTHFGLTSPVSLN